MRILGTTQFDQCVLNMALINLSNSESPVGLELRQRVSETSAAISNLTQIWAMPHQFTLYVPHPDQEYEGLTLAAGLTQGYNVEVEPLPDPGLVPYKVSPGSHFVVVMKQTGLDQGFAIAATGLFVRPLAALVLDIIVDREIPEYQAVVVQHPIVRDYPSDWESKLKQFLNQEIPSENLPSVVNHVDSGLNPDFRPPAWDEVHLTAKGFAGV